MLWFQQLLTNTYRLAGFDPQTPSTTFQQPLAGYLGSSCPLPELSCHNASIVKDLCCFNAPGGVMLQTQFWDTHPPTGPRDSWTLHGLWPDNCDGTYEAYCDDSRHYRNITAILGEHSPRTLDHMRTYWKDYKGNDEVFWQHEFNKHGTCVSTLEPDCFGEYSTAQEVPLYFDRAVELFDSLPTYHWLSQAGITPSHDKTYTLDEIAAALKSRFEGREVRLGCHYGQLNEIWYFYNVLGSLQSGKFIPTNRVGSPSTCPRTNIRYLPKREARTTSTTVPEPTTSPGRSFQGRGQLKVVRGGNTNACLISRGEWYVSGACATFVASRLDGDKFNLRSSKGHCAVVDGSFYCSQNVKSGVFEANGRLLSYNGSTSFSVDHIARGRRKERVYVGDDHEIALQIAWSS